MVELQGYLAHEKQPMAGHTLVMEKLLAAGADMDAKGEHGFAPLHLAAAMGYAAVVEKLLAAGAVMDAEDDDGHTPLVYAEAHDQEAVAEMLRHYTGTSPIRNSTPPPRIAKGPEVKFYFRVLGVGCLL